MAEAFGIAAGAITIVALFNNCVDCFEYIQIGRQFGRDFERSLLKIDIAKTRLSRWGQAISIHEDPCFATNTPDNEGYLQVQVILQQIQDLFQTLQRSSKRYEINARQGDLARLDETDLKPVAQRLHRRFSAIASQRQKGTSLSKKTKWALYDSKNFRKLVDELTEFVDDLEKLFPVETARRRLVELEIEEVKDEASLFILQDVSDGTDSIFSETVTGRLEAITGRNRAKLISTEEQARVRVGNEWSESALCQDKAKPDSAENMADSVTATGMSGVHIGNRYGGRGIFD